MTDMAWRSAIRFGRIDTYCLYLSRVKSRRQVHSSAPKQLSRGEWGKSGLRGNCSQLSNRVPASRIVVVIVSINRLVLIVGVEIRSVENFD